jgi:hypothetical protein
MPHFINSNENPSSPFEEKGVRKKLHTVPKKKETCSAKRGFSPII